MCRGGFFIFTKNQNMKTLIAGATGNIGSVLLPILASQKAEVAAAGRNLEKLKQRFPESECRPLDFADASTWEKALDGVGRMFFVLPPGSATEAEQTEFFAFAKKAGIEHVVYSSGRTTGPIEGSPLNVTEGLLKKSGLHFTILRPGWFMRNFVNWFGEIIRKENTFFLPAGAAKIALIDVRDIAAVAAEILLHPADHHGKTYALTSFEAIDHHEVAAHLSAAAGREIKYHPLSESDFVEAMTKRGWPEQKAKKIGWLYGFVREGKEAEVSPDVERILGRRPIGFQQFVEDFAGAFSSVASSTTPAP